MKGGVPTAPHRDLGEVQKGEATDRAAAVVERPASCAVVCSGMRSYGVSVRRVRSCAVVWWVQCVVCGGMRSHRSSVRRVRCVRWYAVVWGFRARVDGLRGRTYDNHNTAVSYVYNTAVPSGIKRKTPAVLKSLDR